MYQIFQTFHNHNRNLVLLLLVLVIVLSIVGLISKKPWSKFQRTLNLINLIVIDIQFALGLILYFGLSPLGLKAFSNPSLNVMKDAAIRYIAIEHIAMMLLAWIMVHIGYSKAKKSSSPNKMTLIYYSTSIVFILAWILMKS